mgnify:CR=1 FL=1
MAVDQIILDALAPKGVLRAGINMANFLLVSGACPDGFRMACRPILPGALLQNSAWHVN